MSVKLNILSLSILLSIPMASSALERLSLLPPDAQSYMRVSNTTNFWDLLKQSSVGKLWVDSQVQDFLGNPDSETWKNFFFDDEYDAEDEVFIEQMKMLKGEVILAFDQELENPYIIAAISEADFLKSLEMDLKLNEIDDEPYEILKSSFQDVKIIQYIEDGGSADEESSWQAHLNGTLVLGYTKAWVEKCIVQLKKEAIEEPTGNPILNLTLPLSNLIATWAEKEAAVSDILLEALGIKGVENYSFKLELKATKMVADSHLRIADLSKGIFSMLDTQPSELPTVTFIPENISSLEVGRFNLLRFWQEIPVVLASAMPAVKPQFDLILPMLQQQAGVNFEQDLLVHLDTQYLSFSEVQGGTQTTVIAIELKDSMAFKIGLETLLAAPALQPQIAAGLDIEEFLDHTLYTMKNEDPENPAAFGVSGDYLLYSQPDGLRQTIRSQSSAAAANMAFERTELVKGLRQHVPPRAFGFSAIDWEKNIGFVIRELSKPEYITAMQQGWATSGSPLPPPDFTKLPPVDHLASFFNISYQYIEATDDGLHQRFVLKY